MNEEAVVLSEQNFRQSLTYQLSNFHIIFDMYIFLPVLRNSWFMAEKLNL
jgi:hypothetical protein